MVPASLPRVAARIGVDCLLGGTDVDGVQKILAGSAIQYYPFAGFPEGHPTKLRGKPEEIEPWTGTGGHGGGDEVMLREVFGQGEPDKYRRAADERSGLYSILVGAAANRCFATGQAVRIGDLVRGLTRPVVAPMPDRRTPVPMPTRV